MDLEADRTGACSCRRGSRAEGVALAQQADIHGKSSIAYLEHAGPGSTRVAIVVALSAVGGSVPPPIAVAVMPEARAVVATAWVGR